LHVIINAFWEPLTFELPPLETWMAAIAGCKILDTALDHQEEEKVEGFEYTAQARSMVIFRGKQQWTEERK
jgi:pullulanase/glycogen debranching enzyme